MVRLSVLQIFYVILMSIWDWGCLDFLFNNLGRMYFGYKGVIETQFFASNNLSGEQTTKVSLRRDRIWNEYWQNLACKSNA